jgi:MFS family permease
LLERERTKAKLILAVGVAMFAIGQSLLFVIVAPLTRMVGLSEMQFGWAFTLANITFFIGAAYWGRKSDQVGRKRVFVIGMTGATAGILLMALSLQAGLAGLASGWGMFALLALSRAVYGSLASAIYPVATAYMADVTKRSQRAQGMAVIGGANSLGSILGPALGGGLAFMGVLFPLYVAVGLAFLGCVWAMLFLPEPEKHRAPEQRVPLKFTDPRVYPYLIMWGCFFLVFIALQFITAFYIQDHFGVSEMDQVVRIASMALLVMAVVITLLQGVLFQLVELSPRLLLRLCAPAFTAGVFILGFAPSIPLFMSGFALIGVAFSCASPGISGSASLAVAPHEQGVLAGYIGAASTLGAMGAPLFGTSIYQLAPNAPMLGGIVIFAVLSLYALTIPASYGDTEEPDLVPVSPTPERVGAAD